MKTRLYRKMMQKILENIYEPLFHPNSYGFRPGRCCHDAIEELHAHLSTHEVETVIDVDLSNYFGSIAHQEAIKVIRKKISDPRLIRHLMRMFKSSILTDGELTVSDEGVVQGSCCSPVIANIFADEVICKWLDRTVKTHCIGEVKLIIYADDLVICCQYLKDALRIRSALSRCLQKYGLKINEDKTKLILFSRYKQKRGEDQETFDFLGFTFYIGKSRKGFYVVKLKTNSKRFRAKLKRVNVWVRTNRNKYSLRQLMKTAATKIRGHVQYYGVSHNFSAVEVFVWKVLRILFKWLNRRSQRKSFSWEQFREFLHRENFPGAKICHKLF